MVREVQFQVKNDVCYLAGFVSKLEDPKGLMMKLASYSPSLNVNVQTTDCRKVYEFINKNQLQGCTDPAIQIKLNRLMSGILNKEEMLVSCDLAGLSDAVKDERIWKQASSGQEAEANGATPH